MNADGTKRERARMTGQERREQLIRVGRSVFARNGVANTTVEEIATAAGVTKPLVYEHFGGKEGLYSTVVEEDRRLLMEALSHAFTSGARGRDMIEVAVMGVLTFTREHPDGFRVLALDTPTWQGNGQHRSMLSQIGDEASALLESNFIEFGVDTDFSGGFAQMIIGVIAYTGMWWLEEGSEVSQEVLAAQITNFVYNGLHHLERDPRIGEQARAAHDDRA